MEFYVILKYIIIWNFMSLSKSIPLLRVGRLYILTSLTKARKKFGYECAKNIQKKSF